ncbi:MAG: hypothetical protein E7214_01465 [Clostridium sp.]|nr:hypothetical protein [Clostridium sp.]
MRKILVFVSSLVIALSLGSIGASATRIKEVESNNTVNEAQLITRNNVNPSTVITAKYEGQNVVEGNVADSSDVDWYKVYLPADNNTIFAINSTSLSYDSNIEILDENLNIVSAFKHIQDTKKLGATPYKVKISKEGYYYVKISSIVRGGNYLFTIGGPNYTVDSYTYKSANTLTITPKETSDTMSFDLTRNSNIPDGAVVYEVKLGGSKKNSALSETRSLKLSSERNWTRTSSYVFNAKFPVISNTLLKSRWDVKLEGSVSKYTKYYSVTPEIRFLYVYPELPR